MIIFLDGTGAKTALVDMAAAVVVLVVAADMGREQPAHKGAQVPILLRPKDQMEVIGHEAKSQQGHGDVFAGFAEQAEKGSVISVFVENGTAAIASVEDMVAVTTLGSAGISWHGKDYGRAPDRKQEKSTLSPFLGSLAKDLLDKATRQLIAAKGTPIIWRVAEAEAAGGIRALFRENNINILVIHTPME